MNQRLDGMTRRVFGGVLVGGAVARAAAQEATRESAQGSASRRMKILVAGGHPDDPETGCGGTILRYTDAGHEAVVLYLTRGEAGIRDTSHEDAARIRTAEAEAACKIMKARPVFAGQIDGSSEVTPARYAEVRAILEREAPDVVFTHWPVDTHRDHRHCAALVYDSWLALGRKQPLYYYEVVSGGQTQTFQPTDHVDITATVERKHKACFAHQSQGLENVYEEYHGEMERFRGLEARCKYAEGFVRHVQGPSGRLI